MTEQQIQSAIKKKLTTAGWFVTKLIQTSTPGIPDLLALSRAGRLVFIEVKRPGKKPAPLQGYMIEKLQAHKVEAIVAYSVEDVQHLFFGE